MVWNSGVSHNFLQDTRLYNPVLILRGGLFEHVPKYAPFLLLKCAHPQPLYQIGTLLALKCSWRYMLTEHMLNFVKIALYAEIKWAKAHMRHVNPNYGKMAEFAAQHQPLGLMPRLIRRVPPNWSMANVECESDLKSKACCQVQLLFCVMSPHPASLTCLYSPAQHNTNG
eukprot:1150573-Pelagomonas_calceolata.AAC.6